MTMPAPWRFAFAIVCLFGLCIPPSKSGTHDLDIMRAAFGDNCASLATSTLATAKAH